MLIDLTTVAGEVATVRLNGKIACEVVIGEAVTRDALEREVYQARCARAGMTILMKALDRLGTIQNREDHVNTSPDAKRAAYMRGLCAGAQLTTTTTHDGLFELPPDHTPSYREGYEYGEAIARTARAAVGEQGDSHRD